MPLSITHTYPGKRPSNQDAFYVDETGVFVVCDGVGGSLNGHLASGFIAKKLGELLSANFSQINPFFINQAFYKTELLLKSFLIQENSLGSASTLALAVLQNNNLTIAHCGDSKVFVYRNLQKVFETKSHTYTNFLLDKNIITEAEAVNHPQRNKITRLVNGTQHAVLDIQVLDVQTNDIILICSDGVEEGVDVNNLLSTSDDVTQIEVNILEQCKLYSNDNFTFILINN